MGLEKQKNVDRLNDCALEFYFYEHWIYGKQNCVQFYFSSHKSSGLLDLIHFDLFGPIKVPLISKVVYYVSFIDDYSRRTWIYFLRIKSKVFSQFKELKSLSENSTGTNIKVLRTDNDNEFLST
jgi:hypothetical protein